MIREVKEAPKIMNDYLGCCIYRFGFSSVLNDYKILKFYHHHHHQLGEKKDDQDIDYRFGLTAYCDGVEVYSLSTGSWKELEFRASQNTTFSLLTAGANGTIVWLGKQDSCPVVVCFNIVTEVFTLTSLPCVSHFYYRASLWCIREQVCYISV